MPADRKRPGNPEETERQRAKRACRRHLQDLRRAHDRPPLSLQLKRSAVPLRLPPAPIASYCTSPALLCAEIVK